jgi:hypothetical protein
LSIISQWTQATARFLFPFLLLASFIIKIGYIATCDCQAIGQPFNAWFFPAFHHSPWTFYWTFKGITWLAGPYSVVWWILNSPAFFGYWIFFSYLLVCDLAIALLLRKYSLGWAYVWTLFSVWFVTVDPVDFWIVALTFLAHRRGLLLVLAPIAKLPLGSELFVGLRAWSFVLSDPNSLHGPENYSRYLILAVFWTVSVCLYLRERRSKKSSGSPSLESSAHV